MALTKIGRYLAKTPLFALLKQPWIRRRVIFELKQKYYADLHIDVPLPPGLICPIRAADHWHSFNEIFLERTYIPAFNSMPPPKRWIDLGCHAGYFSLFVVWLRKKQSLTNGCEALLIDADPRVELAVGELIELNKLNGQVQFQLGAITAGQGSAEIILGQSMSSAVAKRGSEGVPTMAAPIIGQSEILRLLAPPYDLIKVDIEGAEYDFLAGYEDLLQRTKYLLLEWHSWHDGGGGMKQICQLATERGFRLIGEPEASHAVTIKGKPESCGTLLFSSPRASAKEK